jgi:TonB family protein
MRPFVITAIFFSVLILDLKSQIVYQTFDTTGLILTVDDNFYFPGKSDSIIDFFSKNITYSESVLKSKISGVVTVELSIDDSGKVIESKIVKGINTEVDKEILRVCKLLPNWIPYKNKKIKKGVVQKTIFSYRY